MRMFFFLDLYGFFYDFLVDTPYCMLNCERCERCTKPRRFHWPLFCWVQTFVCPKVLEHSFRSWKETQPSAPRCFSSTVEQPWRYRKLRHWQLKSSSAQQLKLVSLVHGGPADPGESEELMKNWYTLLPTVMVQWKMGPSNISYLSTTAIFHWTMIGRKSN